MEENLITSFFDIYDIFLSKVTDDMYLELTEEDTTMMLQDLLLDSIPRFEFPRFDIFDYEIGSWTDLGEYSGVVTNYEVVEAFGWEGGYFNAALTQEEINILAINMLIEWLGQQLHTIDLSRMKYAGSDFKMSSQANHMAKLKNVQDAAKQDSLHLQRLYKRRIRTKEGIIQSTMGTVMETPDYGYQISNRDSNFRNRREFESYYKQGF